MEYRDLARLRSRFPMTRTSEQNASIIDPSLLCTRVCETGRENGLCDCVINVLSLDCAIVCETGVERV